MIYHSVEYFDDTGKCVVWNKIIEGLPPEDFPIFLGVGYIKEINQKVMVPIPATDLKEAFHKFVSVMETEGPKHVQMMIDEIRNQIHEQQSKIIVPGSEARELPKFKG